MNDWLYLLEKAVVDRTEFTNTEASVWYYLVWFGKILLNVFMKSTRSKYFDFANLQLCCICLPTGIFKIQIFVLIFFGHKLISKFHAF